MGPVPAAGPLMARRRSGTGRPARRRDSGAQSSGGGVITVVQTAATFNNSASTGVVVTFPAHVTVGDLLIACGGGFDTPSVSDSLGNTWAEVTTVTSNGYTQTVWWAVANASGACALTFTTPTSHPFCSCAAGQYHSTGVGTWHFDQATQALGTGGAQASGPVTTLHAPEALIGWNTCATATGLTPGAGWTGEQAASTYTLLQDQVATATGTFNSQSTSGAATWGANIATFYVA